MKITSEIVREHGQNPSISTLVNLLAMSITQQKPLSAPMLRAGSKKKE
jgi:hypothetical protein